MAKSNIEWTDEVWNPETGCTKVSAGCDNCYAERMSKRLAGRFGYPKDKPFKVTLHEDRLDIPFKWKKPRRIFVNSMGDLFHEDVPWNFINKVWASMIVNPEHTFLILTKRPKRMAQFFSEKHHPWSASDGADKPLPNVWLGVSVEDQKTADERIPLLLQTPAAKRFISIEPMLGGVDLTGIYHEEIGLSLQTNSLSGEVICLNTRSSHRHEDHEVSLDWVIVGGENGAGARPMHPDWLRKVRDDCETAGVPFFFKGWGEWFSREQWEDNPHLVLPDDDCLDDNPRIAMIDGDYFHKIGKKKSGCLLDGKAHREVGA
ncbi:MAG: phage Gp37/Gp68 family protein [Deltaproteobacteria bacterium]|nr:phage Gp37/Gp68 family protein [Deltaproteobacteria bacterium]